MSGDPYPKTQQLARGERRSFRKKASPDELAQIRKAKGSWCRLCVLEGRRGTRQVELHHLIRRSQGGDDVPANLVPLCRQHHRQVHGGNPDTIVALVGQLTRDERRYYLERSRRGAA
jgi:5-methylcytosine-specific restriction endonuclease McrA